MKTKQYRIGHVADQVGVEKFVIRFWEKEFNLSSHRSDGGQRFYAKKDIDQFKQIKTLLYDQGLTIAGARKFLEAPENSELRIAGSTKTTMQQESSNMSPKLSKELLDQITELQQKLIKLRELL